MRMRIFYLITILLCFITLTACASSPTNSSESELNNTESQITESETESEETQTQIDDTQQSGDSDEVAPPDGVSLLSQDQVDWFATQFFNSVENPITNMFLSSEYNIPKNIRIDNLFINGVFKENEAEISTEEKDLLKKRFGKRTDGFLTKFTMEDINLVLKSYLGMTFDETNQVGNYGFPYLEEYKAYYSCRTEKIYYTYDFHNGWKNEDDTITLQYSKNDDDCYWVTLREENGNYYFMSNRKERIVYPPEGVNLLPQETVTWFATSFFNHNESFFPNMFLYKTFDSPENVNIQGVFRQGFRRGEYLEVSQEELDLLQQKGAAIEWDTIKWPIEDMNAVLKEYINLSLEETNKVDLDTFYYLDDYKAYYICVSDTAYTQYDFFNGWTNEDGTITLQYSQWDKEVYRVTLREEDGCYYFVSNMKE